VLLCSEILGIASDARSQPITLVGSPTFPDPSFDNGNGGPILQCPLICIAPNPTTPEVAVPKETFSPGGLGAFKFNPAVIPLPGTFSGNVVLTPGPAFTSALKPGTLVPTPPSSCADCKRSQKPPVPLVQTVPVSTVPRNSGTPDADHAGAAAKTSNDPVNVANGEFVLRATDLSFPGRGIGFAHVRTYRSRIDFNGVLGFGWDHGYNRRLIGTPSPASDNRLYGTGDGTTVPFTKVLGIYIPPRGVRMNLRSETTGWSLVDVDRNEKMTFDQQGFLTSLTDSGGVGLSFTYQNGRLFQVQDAENRKITYSYHATGRLQTVTDQDSGLKASYQYDGDNLKLATNAAGAAESFKYSVNVESSGSVTYIPEPFLQQSCRAQCGASCPANADATTKQKWCTSQKTACEASCKPQCPSACRSGCLTECAQEHQPSHCASFCASQPLSAFQQQCQVGADATCVEECKPTTWHSICQGKCEDICTGQFVPKECHLSPGNTIKACTEDCTDCMVNGNNCPSGSCNDGVWCFLNCRSLIMRGHSQRQGICFNGPLTRPTTVEEDEPCPSGPPLGPPPLKPIYSPVGSCQDVRFEWDTCAQVKKDECPFQCARPDYCSSVACGSFDGNNACVSKCESTACPQACAIPDCASAVQNCPSTCMTSCLAQGRAEAASVFIPGRPVYGLKRDLGHNLTHLYRGDFDNGGQLVLTNVYGPDIDAPGWDAVTSQELSGQPKSTVTFEYIDTEFGGDHNHGLPFDPEVICPANPALAVLSPPLPALHGFGLKAMRSTTVTDPYGVQWVFHFGERGEILRSKKLIDRRGPLVRLRRRRQGDRHRGAARRPHLSALRHQWEHDHGVSDAVSQRATAVRVHPSDLRLSEARQRDDAANHGERPAQHVSRVPRCSATCGIRAGT
jgi:YD repeat-containing protein